jgi:hypothetical protein
MSGVLALPNVHYWSLADIPYVAFDVAFGGKADIVFCAAKCLLLTQSGHSATVGN